MLSLVESYSWWSFQSSKSAPSSEIDLETPECLYIIRVVSCRKIPRTWTWFWVCDGDENERRHIFVTKRHIPGSLWRSQVSKKFFLILPKIWRFSCNLVQMWRFRQIVISFFLVRLATNLGLKTWPGLGFHVLGFSIWARNSSDIKLAESVFEVCNWHQKNLCSVHTCTCTGTEDTYLVYATLTAKNAHTPVQARLWNGATTSAARIFFLELSRKSWNLLSETMLN